MSSALRDGRRLVAVTINAPDDWADHAALLEEGFSKYTLRQIVAAGACLGSVEVEGGEDSYAELLAAEDFFYALAADEEVTITTGGTGFVYAPVVEGAGAGFAWIRVDGSAVGKVALHYGKTVERIPGKDRSFWERVFGGNGK